MEMQHDLAKWLEGGMTRQELAAFEQSADFKSYEKIIAYTNTLKAPAFDTELMWAEVTAPRTKTIRLQHNWLLRIAAVLVIGIGLFFASVPMQTTTELTQNKMQKTFLLPDDSEVTLNSASQIEYKKWNWTDHRELQLEGEAFFKVTKGQTFDVLTRLGKVTVVGTQFNVKARGDRFEVICFEGKVRITTQNKNVLLSPGMSAYFEAGKPLQPEASSLQKPGWLNHLISFCNDDLDTVIAEIERQYDVKISKQKVDSNHRFTGNVPSDDLEMALYIISKTYNLNYYKAENNITLTAR
ncbi:MAG TPA: FecR family protein [Flavobacterium sp.]|jgi:transmembrane sensor|nr:FecR family protein [Flavobacterium sp.]